MACRVYNNVLLHARTLLFNRKYTTSHKLPCASLQLSFWHIQVLINSNWSALTMFCGFGHVKLHVIMPHPYPYFDHAGSWWGWELTVIVIIIHPLSFNPFDLETILHCFQVRWIWIAQADTTGERQLLDYYLTFLTLKGALS